jgi:hypothetical protein
MMLLNTQVQFLPEECAQPKRDMDGEGQRQTHFQIRQRGAESMYSIDRRLKSGGPKSEGVDGEMQEKERAEDETGDGEVTARAGVAAARAGVLCCRGGKIHRQ